LHSEDAPTLQSKVAQLEAEVMLLKDQLGKAKGVNDMMWETIVQRVLVNGKNTEKK
jgi:pre-rRNA-processing protein IPI3